MSQVTLLALETPSQYPVVALVDSAGVIITPGAGDATLAGTQTFTGAKTFTPITTHTAGWRLAPIDPSGATYAMQHATSTFESGLYSDTTTNWGYNVSTTPGVKAVAGQPMFFIQIESKFRQNSGQPYGSEFHLNFARPTDTGVYNRPISMFMEHVTGLTTTTFAGAVSISTSDGTNNRYVFGESAGMSINNGANLAMNFNPSTSGTAGANMYFVQDAQFPAFYFRSNGTMAACFIADVTNKDLTVQCAGAAGFNIRHTIAGAKGITITAPHATPTADQFQIRASDQFTVWSRFDRNGYFMTAKNAAPADARVDPGEMALWFDATNGAGKLMVKAKTADGTVVTGNITLA